MTEHLASFRKSYAYKNFSKMTNVYNKLKNTFIKGKFILYKIMIKPTYNVEKVFKKVIFFILFK